MIDLKNLKLSKLEDFSSHLNETFTAHLPTGDVSLKLIKAESLGQRPDSPGRKEPFSLIFECPKNTELDPNSIPIEHEKLGRQKLLLTPILMQADSETIHLEAVFS